MFFQDDSWILTCAYTAWNNSKIMQRHWELGPNIFYIFQPYEYRIMGYQFSIVGVSFCDEVIQHCSWNRAGPSMN